MLGTVVLPLSNLVPYRILFAECVIWALRVAINLSCLTEQGEPTTSYRWTGWVLEITSCSSRLLGNLPIALEEFREYTSKINKEKPEDANM